MRTPFISWLSRCSLLLITVGCATEYDPNDWYDANATEKVGRIIGKKVAKTEERRWADREAYYLPIGGGMLIDNTSGRRTPVIAIYEYTVKFQAAETIAVLSEFPSHEVGECVKVFFSTRPSYPRLAISTACP